MALQVHGYLGYPGMCVIARVCKYMYGMYITYYGLGGCMSVMYRYRSVHLDLPVVLAPVYSVHLLGALFECVQCVWCGHIYLQV